MRILFIGDIVGSPGRQIVHDRLADLVAQRHIDLVIANGENSAAGFGITPRIAEELLQTDIALRTSPWFLSICTPKPPARKLPSAGIWTDERRWSWAPTLT